MYCQYIEDQQIGIEEKSNIYLIRFRRILQRVKQRQEPKPIKHEIEMKGQWYNSGREEGYYMSPFIFLGLILYCIPKND